MIMTQEGSSVYQHAWIEHPNLRSEGRVLSGSMSMMGAATGTPSGVPSMPGGMPSGMPGGMPSGMPELPSGLSDMLGGMAVAVPGMPAGAMGGAGTTMKGISKGGVMYVNVPSMFCKKWIKIDYAAFGVEVPTAQKVEEYWADPPSYMQINCWEVEDIPDSYFELPAGAETTDLQTLLSAVTDIENMFSGGSIGDLEGAIGKIGFPFDPCEEEPTGTLPVDVEDYCKLKPGETLGEYEPQPELSPAYCPIGGMPPAGLEPPPKSGWPARAKVCLNSMRTWVQDASDWAGEKEALAGDYYAKQWGQSGNPLWAIPAVASYGGNDLISTLCEPTDWVQSAVMLDDPDVGRGTKVCVALAMALPIASGAFGKKVANIVSGYADEAVGAATRKVDNILGRAPASSASKLDVARAVDVGDASTADAFKAGTTGTANARPSSGINVPDPNTEAKSAASIKDSVVQSAGPYKTTAKEFLKVGDSGKTYKRIMDDFVEETKNNIDTPIITAEGNYRKTYLIPDDLPRSSLPPGILTAKVPEGPVAVKVIDYAPSMGPGGKWGDAMDFEGSPGLTPNELPHVDLINERDNMAEVNKALAAKGYKRFFPEVYDVEYKRTRVGTLTRGLEVDEDAARRGMMCGKTGDPIYAVKGMASMERLQEKSVRDIESEFKELMGSTPDPTSKAEQLLQKVNDKLKQTGDDLDSLLKEHDLIWNDPHAENMAMAFEYKGTKYYSAEDVLASGADIGDVEVYMRAYEMGGAVKEAGKGGLVRLKYRDELRVR